ncbi:membrane bound lytic murein transglycosylase D [Legionella birminghamensis]|uniref:Membrane bound lytic murein transglycosylase D n=1 Tax=Legionella birminghamensis TaxID=28083 RepID=A0A378I9H0_9GAMM|nr:LysM peptidoglycan-binding domain-containing protein [Legionella birminghamensis]KTC67911.1 membrane bound lytic murein transglycosylase D [Legionella birminghamensis]STX31380.1 membrane bound lytic murein transglycosylase D [Legionella birminghamensis]
MNLSFGWGFGRSVPTVWEVLRSQLKLNHEVTQPEVQNQIQWLINHPSYLQKLARAEPYMYHIVTEVKKRDLPGELALIPMLESAYDPFAYSGAGAAGLWQLMPGTGNNLGLKQDWWFDGRRSITPSTDAALNYLKYLGRYFNGNWVLAIAAYDSGEGTISRAIKNSGQTGRAVNFWVLPVPNETRFYVPRLLALAEIIKYPQRYKISLPEIPHVPYFEEVNIGSQIDLNHAAKLAGISYTDLIKLNPGYNRWATAPYKPFKLLIPATKVAAFNRNLAHVPQDKRVSWTRHLVRKGDNLDSIAQRYFTTVKLLREVNQLHNDRLKNGQFILIPSTKNAPRAIASNRAKPLPLIDKPASTQTYKVIHIVQNGEDIHSIEKKYQVTAANIEQWNQLNANKALVKGQQLVIWREKINPGIYTVKAGDSLSIIAKRNNTSVANLARLNPKLNMNVLKPGQQLFVG